MVSLNQIFLWAFSVWVVTGLLWLMPKKLKLMKRVGILNNHELNVLAKNGDIEARRLKRQTTVFVIVGIAVLVPLRILSR